MSTQHQALTSKVFDLFQYEKILQNSTIGFLLLLQLANKRKKLFIYRKEGAWPPQGGRTKWRDVGCQVGRVGCHFSHTNQQVSKHSKAKGRAPPLCIRGCHLKRAPPLQEGRTSFPTCAPIQIDLQSINIQSHGYCPL
jgi:hypothetical protein